MLLHSQYYDEAALTLLCYEAFLRASEGMELRTACFTPPEITVSPDWSLVLAASEFGSQSKTGVIDDSVLWDSQSLNGLLECSGFSNVGLSHGFLAKLHRRWQRPGHPRGAVPVATRWTHMGQTSKLQASMVRYEKSSRVVADYQKIPENVRRRRPWTLTICSQWVAVFRKVARGGFSVAWSGFFEPGVACLPSLPVAHDVHNSRAGCSEAVSYTNQGLHTADFCCFLLFASTELLATSASAFN